MTATAPRHDRPRSDALVFFGATGDLAYKKIFPALQSMIRHGDQPIPVIGVARQGWNVEQEVPIDEARKRGYDVPDRQSGEPATA